MKKLGFVLLAVLLVGAGYFAGARRGPPMAPSRCSASVEGASEAKGDRKIAFYRSPMDPSIHSDHPTQDYMGMDFIPVYEDEVEAPTSNVEGRAAVTIPADRRQLLGVRSETLTRGPLSRSIRTVGRIMPDERRLHHIHTRFDGFVEHVYVDFIGKFREEGRPAPLHLQPRTLRHPGRVPAGGGGRPPARRARRRLGFPRTGPAGRGSSHIPNSFCCSSKLKRPLYRRAFHLYSLALSQIRCKRASGG